jgi:hypothetical protein
MLLTDELVKRALRQRQSTSGVVIELRVWMPADLVRVELQGPRDLLLPSSAPREPHHGQLIEELADRWSIDVDQHDACSWFEIDRHALPAVPAS